LFSATCARYRIVTREVKEGIRPQKISETQICNRGSEVCPHSTRCRQSRTTAIGKCA